jgi:hypothetical protein
MQGRKDSLVEKIPQAIVLSRYAGKKGFPFGKFAYREQGYPAGCWTGNVQVKIL